MAQQSVLILNGPNLNMLGVREPHIYGSDTLIDIESRCMERSSSLNIALDFRQSNIEGELVTWIQQARREQDGLIINAGAYTHTSVAILDALRLFEGPIIELHLSNIHAREGYRSKSIIAEAAKGIICGFGADGYTLALDAIARLLDV